jgi:hypothetical protein
MNIAFTAERAAIAEQGFSHPIMAIRRARDCGAAW